MPPGMDGDVLQVERPLGCTKMAAVTYQGLQMSPGDSPDQRADPGWHTGLGLRRGNQTGMRSRGQGW